ncbi:protein kinase domain-containing protein [Streptomyces atratus]|uniref:non-specific serine/threonine protein kinase n=1 Tax=Streptomyces atratus TaxID=1893 RepID=A0A2Z5JNP6_STRAR|nr:protein kinase [Streptomyces atratus]AXE81884.1 serine/threonine protein kinase [Streptomyces atratus]
MSGTNGDGRDERDDSVDGGIKPLAVSDPARIGPYLLLGRLGAGGMGRVFLARSDSGRTVAVKVVHEEHVSDEQFRARFRREIEAARRVGERYTAPVLDAGPGDEQPWVATGYVPGLSLEQVVRLYGPLPAAALHSLADGLLKALKDIHGAGIVHRDLKPSNVMLTVDGTKVIDFGIARALETSVDSLLTSTGMVIGSPGFMSPEQVRGQRAGVKSDVFTLGCVLTYAATGQLPFGQGASNQHAVMFQIVEGEPDLTRVEDVALRTLIARCLTKGIDQRPDVDELLEDPERPRPRTVRGAWLPAGVVAHLAQQSARLLDAEAAPLREGPVDLATVGLRPKNGLPEAVVADNDTTTRRREHERRPRRRQKLIVLPIVAVITVGGGTVVLLQPFEGGGGDGTHAQSPGSSPSATPGGSNSPSAPSSSPSRGGNGKDGGDGKGENGEKGQDSEKGRASEKGPGGTNARESDGSSSEGNGGSDSGGTGTSGGTGSTGSSGSTGSPDASGSDGGDPSGSGGSSSGSRPPAMKSYKAVYTNSCVGACDMPIKVSWPAISGATRYDIHYTNTGSNFTKKNVDTTYSTGSTSYTIKGPYSGDEICVTVRAANKYGASAWAETLCDTVPY